MAQHYTPSDYKLKYYHVHRDQNGLLVRLEIHEKTTNTPVAKMIGELCEMKLTIQGDQDDVEAPIVKTNLQVSMIDTWDRGTTTQDRIQTKHGSWSEFYTPDSTKYLVVVKTLDEAAQETDYSVKWRGYITPDSWQESLDYYGAVSITARDNIGHLQDFDFDAEGDEHGLISVRQLVTQALNKVQCPMDSDIRYQDYYDDHILEQSGLGIYDMMLNVEMFQDKSWYEALETTLGDLGLTIRYRDNAKLVVDSVRNMALMGKFKYDDVRRAGLVFFSGTRTKNPPYKEMETTIKYDVEQNVEYPLLKGLEFTTASTGGTYKIRCNYTAPNTSGYVERSGNEDLDNTASNTGPGWSTSGMFMNHNSGTRTVTDDAKERTGVEPDKVIFAGVCLTDSNERWAEYNFGRVNSLECKVRLRFISSIFAMSTWRGAQEIRNNPNGYLTGFSYRLYYENPDGTVVAYNHNYRAWSNNEVLNEYTTSDQFTENWELDLSAAGAKGKITNGGILYLRISKIQAVVADSNIVITSPGGIYLGITGIDLETVGGKIESDKTRTINDERYNVKNSTDANLGVISRPIFWQNCKNYLNVLYDETNAGLIEMIGPNFSWSDSSGETPMSDHPDITIPGSSGEYPLPALIHLERLLWHGATTDIIEGACKVQGYAPFRFDELFEYKSMTFYLMSATLDLLTGYADRAAMIEAFFALPEE